MPFWPWSLLGFPGRTSAAGSIVVLIAGLFNGHGLDVGVSPGIQLEAIEADALLPDREFTDMRPDGVLEFVLAHAEVARRVFRAQESRLQGCRCSCSGVCHGVLLRPIRP
ncbi:hypothetical protein PVLB_08930 [Pseudomonas sp. VLB120]|nr:hypothetical protein PVLB_08930 [Pseudomonas sp. VLB120]